MKLNPFIESILTSCFGKKPSLQYDFAFLIHPRNIMDITEKIKLFKFLPKFAIKIFEYVFCPVSIGKIEFEYCEEQIINAFVKPKKQLKKITGVIISIPMTAQTILQNKQKAKNKIQRAVLLAKKYKVKAISLGALTAPVAAKELTKKYNNVTDGRLFTGLVVFNSLMKISAHNLSNKSIAIVGASLDVGRIVSFLLAHAGVDKINLIDTDDKKEKLYKLQNDLQKLKINSDIYFGIPEHKFDIYITLSAKLSLRIFKKHVHNNTIIINDAQPWGFDDSVIGLAKVYQGGVVKAEKIKVKGIDLQNMIYSCIAEGILLTVFKNEFPRRCDFDFSVELKNDLEKVQVLANKLGIKSAPFEQKLV